MSLGTRRRRPPLARDVRSVAFERAPVALVAVGRDGAILDLNVAGAALLRRRPSLLAAQPFAGLVAGESLEEGRALLRALGKGLPWSGTLCLRAAKRSVDVACNAAPNCATKYSKE